MAYPGGSPGSASGSATESPPASSYSPVASERNTTSAFPSSLEHPLASGEVSGPSSIAPSWHVFGMACKAGSAGRAST